MTNTSDDQASQPSGETPGHAAQAHDATGTVISCLVWSAGGALALFFLLNWITSGDVSVFEKLLLYPIAVCAGLCVMHGPAVFSLLAGCTAASVCVLHNNTDDHFDPLPGLGRLCSIFHVAVRTSLFGLLLFFVAYGFFYVTTTDLSAIRLAYITSDALQEAHTHSWTSADFADGSGQFIGVDGTGRLEVLGHVKPVAVTVGTGSKAKTLGFSISLNIDDCRRVVAQQVPAIYRLARINGKDVSQAACSNVFFNDVVFETSHLLPAAWHYKTGEATGPAKTETARRLAAPASASPAAASASANVVVIHQNVPKDGCVALVKALASTARHIYVNGRTAIHPLGGDHFGANQQAAADDSLARYCGEFAGGATVVIEDP